MTKFAKSNGEHFFDTGLDSGANRFLDFQFYASFSTWFGVHRPPYVFYKVLVPPFFRNSDPTRSGAVPKLERNWPDLDKNWSLNAGVVCFDACRRVKVFMVVLDRFSDSFIRNWRIWILWFLLGFSRFLTQNSTIWGKFDFFTVFSGRRNLKLLWFFFGTDD